MPYVSIVVDIDDTLLQTTSTNGVYKVVGINTELINRLNKYYDEGATIIVHTARHWDKYRQTKKQIDDCGLKYHSLVLGNITADVYINDKGVTPNEFLAR